MTISAAVLRTGRRSGQIGWAVVALGGVAILCNAFVVYFVGQEHFIYSFDYSNYWIPYRELGASLVDHPLSALLSVAVSIRNTYNLWPVLPMMPFEWLLGPGRLAYVLAITNLYVLPGAVVLAFFAQEALWPKRCPDDHPALQLALVTGSILLLHPLWVPVLRGYPDVVGIVAIAAILLLHFTTPFAGQKLKSLVATGLLLCVLVVLRRWYLFWVVAFFPAALLAHGLEIYQQHGLAWRRYLAIGRNVTIVGLVFVVSMVAFAAPLARKIVGTDYADIYSAYRTSNSLLEAAGLLPGYFGWAVIIVSVSGLIWLAVRRETRVAGLFLITQSIIIFVLFARTQDFGVHHYLLLFPAVALGVAAVVIGLSAKTMDAFWRTVSVGLVIAVLLASSGAVFAPQAASLSGLGSFVPKERTYPLVRNDTDAVNRLLDRLGDLEQRQPGDIYVVASSYHILNSEIVTNGCTIGPPQRNFCDRILVTNDVDKRDGFPRQFLHASYVVVANPPQYHLRPTDQRVIGVLARELTAGHGIGASFQRLPDEFRLDDGVTVSLYAKVRPFEKADLAALMAEFTGYYPDRKSMFITKDD